MEFRKKQIIYEENNQPPKNYIWVKEDGKAYEFNYNNRQWEVSDININDPDSMFKKSRKRVLVWSDVAPRRCQLWVKEDGKIYQYTKEWIESEEIQFKQNDSEDESSDDSSSNSSSTQSSGNDESSNTGSSNPGSNNGSNDESNNESNDFYGYLMLTEEGGEFTDAIYPTLNNPTTSDTIYDFGIDTNETITSITDGEGYVNIGICDNIEAEELEYSYITPVYTVSIEEGEDTPYLRLTIAGTDEDLWNLESYVECGEFTFTINCESGNSYTYNVCPNLGM